MNNFAKPNSPILKCPSTSESYGGSYRLKAGLITADEFVLAGESIYVEGNSYLIQSGVSNKILTMSPGGYDYYDIQIYVYNYDYFYYGAIATNAYSVRPVINVTTENGFTSGDGTVENPYVLS